MWLQLHVYGMSVIRESDLKVVERAGVPYMVKG